MFQIPDGSGRDLVCRFSGSNISMPADLISYIKTASLIKKFVSGDEMLDCLASIDMNAAVESIRKSKISDWPRDHYLSARNHLEGYVEKKNAAMKGFFMDADINGYERHCDDKIYALGLISIIDFELRDLSACKDTLTKIETQVKLKQKKRDDWYRQPGSQRDIGILFIPKMIYYDLTSKAGRISDPTEFCKQMRLRIGTAVR